MVNANIGQWVDTKITKEIRNIYDRAIADMDGSEKDSAPFCTLKINKVEKQVVAGMKYKFHVDITNCDDDEERIEKWVYTIWVQAWEDKYTIVDAMREDAPILFAQDIWNPESAKEEKLIKLWIEKNGYNEFGDVDGTRYTGGNPLFDEVTGETINVFDYIVARHPLRPWLDKMEIPEEEKNRIDAWIVQNGYNEFGDEKGTMYIGGTPLFDMKTGQYMDRYEYIKRKHYSTLPWKNTKHAVLSTDRITMDEDAELKKMLEWLDSQGLNQYGDAKNTMYTGGTPLFNEQTGESMDLQTYLRKKFPNEPWLSFSTNKTPPHKTSYLPILAFVALFVLFIAMYVGHKRRNRGYQSLYDMKN